MASFAASLFMRELGTNPVANETYPLALWTKVLTRFKARFVRIRELGLPASDSGTRSGPVLFAPSGTLPSPKLGTPKTS
jgi:hypothetical protein